MRYNSVPSLIILWSIFIRLTVVRSQICEIPQNFYRIGPYSSSRSSKVIDLDVNRKCIVSPTVFEILTFKVRKWLVFPTPPVFDAPTRGNPLEFLDANLPHKS